MIFSHWSKFIVVITLKIGGVLNPRYSTYPPKKFKICIRNKAQKTKL